MLEKAKLDVGLTIAGLGADIIAAQRAVKAHEDNVKELESLYRGVTALNESTEDILLVTAALANARKGLSGARKALADKKSELAFLKDWPAGRQFVLSDGDYSPEGLRKIMAENGFELDRYYALALADKAEEAEYYLALVPGHIFKYLDMSIRAEWREDILRRILSCDLNRRIA